MLKCKTSIDIAACVEVISALHQRFPDTFTLLLSFQLAKALQPPTKQHLATLSVEQKEKEESARIIRQRTYLRIVCELWLVGVLRSVQDGIPSLSSVHVGGVETHRDAVAGLISGGTAPSSSSSKKAAVKKDEGGFVYKVLYDMLNHDMEQYVNLPLVASFLKNYGQVILNIVPRKQRAALEQHDEQVTPVVDPESVVTPDIHALLTNLFQTYYKSVAHHLSKMHKVIKKMERHNNEVLFARGELSDETKQRYEKATKAYEKILLHTQTLSDALDMDMPDLPVDDGATKQSIVTNSGNMFNDGKENLGNGIWEDEDARKFYEDLPDLRILVPDVFLDSQQTTSKEEQTEKKEVEEKQETEEVETANFEEDDAQLNELDPSELVDEAIE